jgi:hypothetical protein
MPTAKDEKAVDRDRAPLPPGEWIALRRSLAATDFIVVVHADTRVVLLADSIAVDTGLDEVADRVAALVDEPMLAVIKQKPAPPSAVRVEDAALAEALRARLERAVPVVVGSVAEAEPLLAGLAQAFGGAEPETNVLPFRAGRVGEQTLAAFFTAANRLYLCAPWDAAHDSHVFAVEAETLGWPKGACATFIGSTGADPGVLVFRSLEDYLRFIEQADRAEQMDETPMADCPVFSINFDAKRDVPRDRVKRAKAAALRPADPQGFPWLQRFAPQNRPIEIVDDDYAFAAALLDALAGFVETHAGIFDRSGLESPLESEGVFEAAGERQTLRVIAPHPDVPWPWGDTAIEYYRWWEADEVRDEFLTATRGADRSAADEEALAEAVAQIFRCKIEYQSVEPLDFAHDDVEQFLLEYFPALEFTADADVPHVPDRVAQFIRWLGESGRIDQELAQSLVEDIDRLRDEFLVRARDPKLFGPEKRLVAAMQAAGIDTDDEAAVARFMDEYVDPYPDLEDPEAVPRAAEKKWTWTAGEPAPDPKGACPCGSGKRYKKCCMPR